MDFLQLLAKEWGVVSQAPITFCLLAASMFGLAYMAAHWKFSSIVEQIKSSNAALNDRLLLRTDQAEQYKDRAHKYDQRVWEVVESDTSSLVQKTLSLVAEIRAFIERHRRNDEVIHDNEWVEMTHTHDEHEKQRLWNKFTSASARNSNERNAEWERRFKVDSIMLRDELLSRLPEHKQDSHMNTTYEHPTNYFGFNDVAADLEKMAKLLPNSGNPQR